MTMTPIDYFLQLLKITRYQESYLFSKLIKDVFLYTAAFINSFNNMF